MGLPAGDFTRIITIRKRGVGVDALNRPNMAFADYASGVHASFRQPNGMSAILAAEGVSSTINRCSWRVRYRTDITLDMQVFYDGQQYAIVSIQQDVANKDWTDLVCVLGALP